MISGALARDGGEILFDEKQVEIASPEDARALGIETMYQDLALVPDLDVAGNVFLGCEPLRRSLRHPARARSSEYAESAPANCSTA